MIMHLVVQGNGGGIGSGDTFAPDRTNNVEQVSLSYLPPGEVAIEVRYPPSRDGASALFILVHRLCFSSNAIDTVI